MGWARGPSTIDDQPSTFRIGLTGDFLDAAGRLAFPDVGLDLLEAPADSAQARRVEWEFIAEDPSEITPEIAARYDAIVALRPRFTARTVSGADRRLALVARFGVGYDRVDVPALTRAGVLLAISPDGVRRPVAQAVLTFILALAGRLIEKDRVTRQGQGWARASEFMGLGVTGRTLGLVGVGNIGRDVVRLVRPFEMDVLGYDPYAPSGLEGVRSVDLETLLRESDFVSVNCPLNEQTHHLIGARELGLMKPSSYLINTARGPIVDEAALYRALHEHRIAGAGLDVFEQEPTPPENPILRLDNVVVTPHALCWTDECFRGNGAQALGHCLALARGEPPTRGLVNPEALDHPWLRERLRLFGERWAATPSSGRGRRRHTRRRDLGGPP
ncbi:MAG TPA: NAD(P)-dependent oxidoreductase [Chloroflexota bacterium]